MSEVAQPPVLEVRGITKALGGRKEILRGISFEVEEGKVLAIIGASGSGRDRYAASTC